MDFSHKKQMYQQLILDHNRSPKNFFKMEHCRHSAEGFNPLCGDHYWVYLQVENDIVQEMSFHGEGCAISKSSASMMTDLLKGCSFDQFEKLFDFFHKMLLGGSLERESLSALGKLCVFEGVKNYPSRVKCATLVWHSVKAALRSEKKISTE